MGASLADDVKKTISPLTSFYYIYAHMKLKWQENRCFQPSFECMFVAQSDQMGREEGCSIALLLYMQIISDHKATVLIDDYSDIFQVHFKRCEGGENKNKDNNWKLARKNK